MKTTSHAFSRTGLRTTLGLALLVGCLAAGLAAAHAAPPSVQPLLPGKWPTWPRGTPRDVKVVGSYAYVALGVGGLAVVDVSNPTNCVRVGGYDTVGFASGVAMSGDYAYVPDGTNGLQVIDVSDPTDCVRVGGYDTSGIAYGVAVVAGRIYVAADVYGLLVLPTLPNVQFTVRVDEGTLGTPYTLEAATSLTPPIQWSPLWTTNPPALPFDYVDFDVKLAEKPHKDYRVRQS